MIVGNDTKDAERGGTILALTAQDAGVKADQGTTVPRSGRDPQSAYTSIVQGMKTDNSNFSLMTSAANSALELRDEAALQGLDSSKVEVGVRVVLRQQRRDRATHRPSRVSTSSWASCPSRRRSPTRPSPRSSSTWGRQAPTSSRPTRSSPPSRSPMRSRPRWPRAASTASPGLVDHRRHQVADRLQRRRHGGYPQLQDRPNDQLLRRWCSSRAGSGCASIRRRRAPSTARRRTASSSRRTCSAADGRRSNRDAGTGAGA